MTKWALNLHFQMKNFHLQSQTLKYYADSVGSLGLEMGRSIISKRWDEADSFNLEFKSIWFAINHFIHRSGIQKIHTYEEAKCRALIDRLCGCGQIHKRIKLTLFGIRGSSYGSHEGFNFINIANLTHIHTGSAPTKASKLTYG